MPKSAKKQTVASSAAVNTTAKPTKQPIIKADTKKPGPVSKQSRVLAMLRSPDGATIAAMMRATGWQQHSVRGFLAGVVRKKLKLKLHSTKVDGTRIYHIDGETMPKANRPQSKRRAA